MTVLPTEYGKNDARTVLNGFVCVLGIELRDSCLLDKYSTTTCSHFAFTLFFREALELLLGVGWRECDSHCHPPTCTY
jgi:hypothetical protein